MKGGTWKRRERQVAALLGGRRVGPSGINTNDVEHPLLAIEVKARKRIPALATDALEQARTAVGAANKVPCAVLVQEGQRIGDALIIFRLRDFEDLHGRVFGPEPTEVE